MSQMSYRQLREIINNLPEEHLDDSVTIEIGEEEWIGIPEKSFRVCGQDDYFDEGQLILNR